MPSVCKFIFDEVFYIFSIFIITNETVSQENTWNNHNSKQNINGIFYFSVKFFILSRNRFVFKEFNNSKCSNGDEEAVDRI